jgi:hypothetical protein
MSQNLVSGKPHVPTLRRHGFKKKPQSNPEGMSAAAAIATAAVARELCSFFIATDCFFDGGDSF